MEQPDLSKISETPRKGYTGAQLKVFLGNFGLPKSGKKEVLAKRLRDHLMKGSSARKIISPVQSYSSRNLPKAVASTSRALPIVSPMIVSTGSTVDISKISEKSREGYTGAQLKKFLGDYGLLKSGKKAVLAKRLRDHLMSSGIGVSSKQRVSRPPTASTIKIVSPKASTSKVVSPPQVKLRTSDYDFMKDVKRLVDLTGLKMPQLNTGIKIVSPKASTSKVVSPRKSSPVRNLIETTIIEGKRNVQNLMKETGLKNILEKEIKAVLDKNSRGSQQYENWISRFDPDKAIVTKKGNMFVNNGTEAAVRYYKGNTLIGEEFFENGVRHRDEKVGPAIILKQAFLNKELGMETVNPFMIARFTNGKLQSPRGRLREAGYKGRVDSDDEDDKKPTIIAFDRYGKEKLKLFYENDILHTNIDFNASRWKWKATILDKFNGVEDYHVNGELVSHVTFFDAEDLFDKKRVETYRNGKLHSYNTQPAVEIYGRAGSEEGVGYHHQITDYEFWVDGEKAYGKGEKFEKYIGEYVHSVDCEFEEGHSLRCYPVEILSPDAPSVEIEGKDFWGSGRW